LAAAGFLGTLKNAECIAFSPATADGNKTIHAKANEQLLQALLTESPGEMRALADPFHRRLCAELAKRANTKFTVVYDIPEEYSQSPDGVRKWNAQRWASKAWTQKLSAMNLIGEAFVDVRAYNTLPEVQYSVFGNRYVLAPREAFRRRKFPCPIAEACLAAGFRDAERIPHFTGVEYCLKTFRRLYLRDFFLE
jgi:hypothetical protein